MASPNIQLLSSREAMDVIYSWQEGYQAEEQYLHAIACDVVIDWIDGAMKGLPRSEGWAAVRNILTCAASDERDDYTGDVSRRALDYFPAL